MAGSNKECLNAGSCLLVFVLQPQVTQIYFVVLISIVRGLYCYISDATHRATIKRYK